jgi:uncharacterized lipoprotein YbaY/heat shock protein HslJ/uncharacterized lipoprotein NlpE involved in copper resistance
MIRKIALMVFAMGMLASEAVAQTAYVTGTVFYRERIALPATAILEMSLEDVSRADAPATPISTARLEPTGQPPIRFELPYDFTKIDASHRYAVRARIIDGGRVLFASTETMLVVTQGHPGRADVLVRMVQAPAPPAPRSSTAAAPAAPPASAPPIALTNLPATFTGTLPCADCPGIRYQLNLFPDDSFFLRTTYGDRPGGVKDILGSWTLSSDRRVVVLKGSNDAPELFSIRDAQTLRKLDADGREIKSMASYDLHRGPRLQPLDIRTTVRGSFRSAGDGAEFVECSTGQRWPVATEGALRDLEVTYRQTRKQPGDAVMVTLEGRVAPATEASRATGMLVVERVVRAAASESCEPRFAGAPLENTYWRLTRLGSTAVPALGGRGARSEAALVFSVEPRTVSGATGCNRLSGGYTLDGSAISFGAAGTMAACPGTTQLETTFRNALRDARSYRILGRVLDLFNDKGESLARLEARDSR